MVIPFAYTGSQPDAMVVVFEHTVIARVAMRSSRRTEDVAGFAVFEFEQLIALHVESVIEYFLRFVRVLITASDFLLAVLPCPRRYYPWVGRCGEDEQDVYYWNQSNLNRYQNPPTIVAVQVVSIIPKEIVRQQGERHQRYICQEECPRGFVYLRATSHGHLHIAQRFGGSVSDAAANRF